MNSPLINPITEVWSQWKGRGYPRATDSRTSLYYISGHLQNLSDPLIRKSLTNKLIQDGQFKTAEKAQEELDKSFLFTGFVLLQDVNDTDNLTYQEPRLATPGQVAYAVTWVEVRIAH